MRIKINATKKNNSSSDFEYQIILPLSNDTQISKTLSQYELNDLLDEISSVLGYKQIAEVFNCSVEDAKDIKEHLERYSDCKKCSLRMKECYRCCKVCESPLEQKLFRALVQAGINVELQMRINKDNTITHYPEPVDSSKILTIPDFYLEAEGKKICVYTDGHTYHERTEYQAVRDRSIDRELQKIGYIVLRYTSSEVSRKIEQVVIDIKKTIGLEDGPDMSATVLTADDVDYDGTCIRCGTKIPYDQNQPLCEDCYQVWAQFSNMEYIERFCHKCGKEFSDSITYRHPLCEECFRGE